MAISVRLKPDTRKLLDRIARSERISRSEAIRRSIEAFARQQDSAAAAEPFHAIQHLIGRVRGGPPDLSERTGAGFTRLLRQKRARHR